MTNLTKFAALEIARDAVKMQADNFRYTGKGAAEVSKFEEMSLAIIAKGEAMDEAFFSALPDDMSNGILKRGVLIARAIHAATKG